MNIQLNNSFAVNTSIHLYQFRIKKVIICFKSVRQNRLFFKIVKKIIKWEFRLALGKRNSFVEMWEHRSQLLYYFHVYAVNTANSNREECIPPCNTSKEVIFINHTDFHKFWHKYVMSIYDWLLWKLHFVKLRTNLSHVDPGFEA